MLYEEIEEEALGEEIYVGGEMAREIVPYALAFKLGHSGEAMKKEEQWTDDEVIEYFRHLSVDPSEVEAVDTPGAEKGEDDASKKSETEAADSENS